MVGSQEKESELRGAQGEQLYTDHEHRPLFVGSTAEQESAKRFHHYDNDRSSVRQDHPSFTSAQTTHHSFGGFQVV